MRSTCGSQRCIPAVEAIGQPVILAIMKDDDGREDIPGAHALGILGDNVLVERGSRLCAAIEAELGEGKRGVSHGYSLLYLSSKRTLQQIVIKVKCLDYLHRRSTIRGMSEFSVLPKQRFF